MTMPTNYGFPSTDNKLGECKAFVGERNERKRQGWLRLRVARGRMHADRGRLMTYKHTYIHTYIQTKLPLTSLVRARCARPINCMKTVTCARPLFLPN